MIPLPHYKDKHLAILGLGTSGRATMEALHESGATIYLWDDRCADEESSIHETLPVAPTHYHEWPWHLLDAVIIAPGIPLHFPTPHAAVTLAREHGVRISCDISLLCEACPDATFIGITGTNGKSTTTALITHMLHQLGAKVACGGNIGIAALALEPLSHGGIYVLELSSYQLDLMDYGVMDIACLLNISPDHLDRHGSMEGYIAAKTRIFRGQHTTSQHTIIAIDDHHTQAIAQSMRHAITVSTSAGIKADYVAMSHYLYDHNADEPHEYDLSVIPTLNGTHNHQNALVAYAACASLGYSRELIYQAMQDFAGLAHRMERVAYIDGVLCINDSKATNADAAARSLASFERIYWIMGGVAKEGGLAGLESLFGRVVHAYAIGQSAEAFARYCTEHGLNCTISHSLNQAVRDAFADASGYEQAVLLLAPAAASFDQFANFERRGEAFKEAVQALKPPISR